MKYSFPLFLVTAWAAMSPVASQPGPDLRITFFSLAGGESTLVQGPGGFTCLVGAGAREDWRDLKTLLAARRIRRLSSFLMCGSSLEHIGGVGQLLEALPLDAFVTSPMYVSTPEGDRVSRLAKGLELLGKLRTVQANPGEAETFFRSPPCTLRAVGPVGKMFDVFKNDPRCSMTCEINYEKVSYLYLGEGGPQHHALLWQEARERPWGHVLQVGRAGAEGSVPAALLKELRTRIAVIPVPRRGKVRPAASTLAALKKAGVKVYRTDTDGTVVVTLGPEGIRGVKTHQ